MRLSFVGDGILYAATFIGEIIVLEFDWLCWEPLEDSGRGIEFPENLQFWQIAQSWKAPSPLTKERLWSLCAYVNMIPAPRRNLWTPLRYVAIPVLPCVHAVTVRWCISVDGLSSLPVSVVVLLPCLNLLWTTVHRILRHDQARTPIFSVRALHVQWTYSSLARAVFSILTRCFANLDERCLVQWLNWGFTTQERKKERKMKCWEDTLGLWCIIYRSGGEPLWSGATFLGS